MRAVDVLGVEPVVALVGLFCQLVVLHVAAADEDLKPTRGFECARGEGALELLFAARLSDIVRLLQFAADLIEFLLGLRLRKLLQDAFQVRAFVFRLFDLLAQVEFGGLELVVLLVVFRGVLLGGEQRVERDVDGRAAVLIVVFRMQDFFSALHAVQVCGDEVAAQAEFVALLRRGVVAL